MITDPYQFMNPAPKPEERDEIEKSLFLLGDSIESWIDSFTGAKKVMNPKTLKKMLELIEKIEVEIKDVPARTRLNYSDIIDPSRSLKAAIQERLGRVDPPSKGRPKEHPKRMCLIYCLSWLGNHGMSRGLHREGPLAGFASAMWLRVTGEYTEPNSWGALMEQIVRDDRTQKMGSNSID